MPENDRYKVLVVDDDASLRRMIRAQLAGHYEATLADGGEQALAMIEAGLSPDIILLDIDMPGMDGWETLKNLRNRPKTEDVPVIFLTGLDGADDQVKGLEAGAEDYITKPFVRDVMLARLRLRLQSGMESRRMKAMREKGLVAVVELDEENFERFTETLNEREKDVAKLMALGYTNQEISAILTYSLDGVKKLATRVFDKTGLPNRYELQKAIAKQ
jgi:DNA-binding response OmpR family regulator